MESSALSRKARNIGERAWDLARVLEELERTLPPDLLARLGEAHALLAKLRADLADPELQGWVVLPRQAAAAPPLDYAQLLRSRPLPEVAAVPPAALARAPAAAAAREAAVAALAAQLSRLCPPVPRPPPAALAAPEPPAPPALAAFRAAFATGDGVTN